MSEDCHNRHIIWLISPRTGKAPQIKKTIDEIRSDIASLREHADKYRKLAEQRRAVDQQLIADKLMELVAELEAKAKQLEAEGQ
jgi:hypothetical protein